MITANWVEAEQLFGCLRQFNGDVSLQPGLVHRANGGVLLISLRTLLAQPLLWMRLKTVVTQQRFDWVGYDDSRPLPVSIPSMPLSLTVVLTGDRESLADFQKWSQNSRSRLSIANLKIIFRSPMPMTWRSGVSGLWPWRNVSHCPRLPRMRGRA